MSQPDPTVPEPIDAAGLLPATAPGHWTTPDGREMAQEYLDRTRESLTHGDKPDLALANAVYLVDRYSLDLIVMQTAAKERIRWLSAQLASANVAVSTLKAAAEGMAEGLETARVFVAKVRMGEPVYQIMAQRCLEKINPALTAYRAATSGAG